VEERQQARLVDLVADHPDIVADLLLEFGYDANSLLQEVYERSGQIAATS